MKDQQGDLFSGKELRDAGIGRVLDHNEDWLELCMREAKRFIATRDTFTGEDIRLHCQENVGYPRHHNAWGGLTNSLIKQHVIRPTGHYRSMRDPSSHARSTVIYTKAY